MRLCLGAGVVMLGLSCTAPRAAPPPEGTDMGGRPAAGTPWTVPGLKMELVPIDPGRFLMGSAASEADRGDDENQHEVTLTRGFWVGRHEVTQGQYEALMHVNPSRRNKGAELPVADVSWDDAAAFCRGLTDMESKAARLPMGYVYRLPTEAEWEYCCRAGSQAAYCFGDDPKTLPQYAWYLDNCRDVRGAMRLHEVGLKRANAWGIYDMHGNAYEWCHDWAGVYPKGPAVDPAGPPSATWRRLRGGCILSSAGNLRSGDRMGCYPHVRHPQWGFRIVLAPEIRARPGQEEPRRTGE